MKLAIIAQLLIVCQFALNASGSASEETTTIPRSEIARIVAIRDEDEYIEAVRKAAIKQWQAVEQIRGKSFCLTWQNFNSVISYCNLGEIVDYHLQDKNLIKGKYSPECTYLQTAYFNAPNKSEMMKLLIDLGASINEVNALSLYFAPTALSSACCDNNLDVVKLLIKSGANVNLVDLKGRTALHYAYIGPIDQELINFLKLHKADESIVDRYGKRPADYAKTDLNGVDAELHASFLKAVRDCNRDEIIKLHSKDKRLVEIDACDRRTLLNYAYGWTRNQHIITLLIKLGANISTKLVCNEDFFQWRPILTQACRAGDIEMVKLLVTLGANIHYKNINGTNIIYDICREGDQQYNSDIVKWLRSQGVNLYEEDIFGYNARRYIFPTREPRFLSLYGNPKSKTKVKID